jgi:hypothetical protein
VSSRASARAIATNAAGSSRSCPPNDLAMASMPDSRVVSAPTVPRSGAGQAASAEIPTLHAFGA